MDNLSLMLKPVSARCNLRCSYCYYSSPARGLSDVSASMPTELLEKVLEQALNLSHPRVFFGWQGGEPTLLGAKYFRRALEAESRFARRGHVIANGLQTNGIRFDKDWAEVCRDYNVLVGLSMDGPPEVHNTYRKDASGRGSWEEAFRASRLLKEFGIAFSILCVVSQANVRKAKEVYRFFRNQGFTGLQFIPCIEPDARSSAGISPESITAEDYGSFLCELFDCWQPEWYRIYIRLFHAIMRTYAGRESGFCNVSRRCDNAVFFESTGDVYTCDFFAHRRWLLGNIVDTSLAEMLGSEKLREFTELKQKLRGGDCDSCPWESACGGGCLRTYPARIPHDGPPNYFCTAMKSFLSYAHQRLEALAKQVVAWVG